MTTNNEERARAWTNVYPGGSVLSIYKKLDTATLCRAEDAIRTAELVELRPGETIVTREMREKIEDFASEEQNYAGFSQAAAERVTVAKTILDILDGKGGA